MIPDMFFCPPKNSSVEEYLMDLNPMSLHKIYLTKFEISGREHTRTSESRNMAQY